MKAPLDFIRNLLAGLYAWIVSVYFGAILLDIVYSRLALDVLKPSEITAMFSHVADLLLFMGMVTVLAAICAIVSSWSLRSARNLFIASILLFVLVEFLTPILFSSLIQKVQTNLGLNIGPWIRIISSGLSSILAFLGLWKLHHPQS
jgi:hypothetical protein